MTPDTDATPAFPAWYPLLRSALQLMKRVLAEAPAPVVVDGRAEFGRDSCVEYHITVRTGLLSETEGPERTGNKRKE